MVYTFRIFSILKFTLLSPFFYNTFQILKDFYDADFPHLIFLCVKMWFLCKKEKCNEFMFANTNFCVRLQFFFQLNVTQRPQNMPVPAGQLYI